MDFIAIKENFKMKILKAAYRFWRSSHIEKRKLPDILGCFECVQMLEAMENTSVL